MMTIELEQVLIFAALDVEFREALFEDPVSTWKYYGLPANDLPLFQTIDRSSFNNLCDFLQAQVLDEKASFENFPLIIAID